ncbi:integrase [Shewanella sp. GutCb]|uniref:tyrosine-type recombinase/integrase n=1 Tax=Shewanella sp. GutCb TaxID=2058315 RepID=UPI000C7B620B|nr:site-specific integrase [Shewanella sp. GutCb]PKG73697.1 integrase [Shewanella sp. GutCb]
MQLPNVMPLFDSIQFIQSGNPIINQHITQLALCGIEDASLVFEHATDWLCEQKFSENNYKAYRSELTTFLHWCFDVAQIEVSAAGRKEISQYVEYCQAPPLTLIGFYNVAQFKEQKGSELRSPNPQWLPFRGKKVEGVVQPYSLSESALKTKMAILSSFYAYLMSEDFVEKNPAQMWLNKSRFSSNKKYRINNDGENQLAFTELQWSYVMSTVTKLAAEQPELHQRSLFLIKLIYACYLRVSEVSARAGYSPIMDQFKRNPQTGIWSFHIPSSKGGKRRTVSMSDALLAALVEYRHYLNLSDYPKTNEGHPLIIRQKAAGRGREVGLINANLGIRQIREEVDKIIVLAAICAENDGFVEDGAQMRQLSIHNIRHTGITHDINIHGRPLSHVQADAGHESIDTTSQYLHTTQIERHQSGQNRPLDNLQGIG